jgi:hypothetical protein
MRAKQQLSHVPRPASGKRVDPRPIVAAACALAGVAPIIKDLRDELAEREGSAKQSKLEIRQSYSAG